MLNRMRELNLYKEEDLSDIKGRYTKGEEMPVLLGRHPYIGANSNQVVMSKMIKGKSNAVIIPEQFYKASIKLDNGEIEALSNPIRLSSGVGFSSDFDADTLSVMIADPKMREELTAFANNPDTIAEYEEFSIRSQIMKAKNKGEVLTLNDMMAGDALKSSITNQPILGKLSTNIQKYKNAILQNPTNLSHTERYNTMHF